MSNFKNSSIQSSNDLENIIKQFQFITNKDPSILFKYNQISQALLTPNKEFFDTMSQFSLNEDDLKEIGVCLCDQNSKGFRCENQILNSKPHQCYFNSTIQFCNPLTSFCRISKFSLSQNSKDEYRSYYCECKNEGVVGLNCEYTRDQCNKIEITKSSNNLLGQIDNNLKNCDSNGFCYPFTNTTLKKFGCLKTINKIPVPFVNHLVFDESSKNSKFSSDGNNKYKRLSLSDPAVLMSLQNFFKEEAIPRFLHKDYTKIPKGPFAILKQSINLPEIINNVRTKLNNLISENDTATSDDILENLISDRVKQLVQNVIVANKVEFSINGSFKQTFDELLLKLNVSKAKQFSTSLWSLNETSIKSNHTLGDPFGLVNTLKSLRTNSDGLFNTEALKEVLSLTAPNEPYLDLFNFSNRPYRLIKLDVLPGVYVDYDGELTLRPTPGIFLESVPKEFNSNKEVIFLPGIFNPSSASDCNIKSVFMPGVMSQPVENFDLNDLSSDLNKYLNKFIPIQLPFNINGLLTTSNSSFIDLVSSLLLEKKNASNKQLKSEVVFTPLDSNPEIVLNILTKNEKFMANLFSNESLDKLVKEQKQLDIESLASTLLISNPTMLPISKKAYANSVCLNSSVSPRFTPKGAQFYNLTNPVQNVNVLNFIFYDENGGPIPQEIVRKSIEKYCLAYKAQLNELHERVCDAYALTSKLKEFQDALCSNCSFTYFVNGYYNNYFNSTNRTSISEKEINTNSAINTVKDYWVLFAFAVLLGMTFLRKYLVF